MTFALLLAGSMNQIVQSIFDDTFAGVYHLDVFDWSLLIPYFAILVVLSCYGCHRYEMIRRYLRQKKEKQAQPPSRWETLPRVTIQLPLYNERYVVERLIEEVSKIDYPTDRLQIQVLDDSTDDTHPFTQALVAEYQAAGLPIEYHHRTNRNGYKAGALQEGMKSATGELIAIFDADFIPPRDFLRRTVDYFTDPAVGVVQTRWSYTNRHYSLLTEVEAMLLDGHFVIEHGARHGSGLLFNFNGTAGILRAKMIEDAGGWQHDTLTEDTDLSYRAQLKGWKFIYTPEIECPSELPVETYAFQVQQSRWAKGLTQVAIKLLPSILRSNISKRAKVEACFHLTPNISYPLMLVISALTLPVMIVRFYMGWFQMLTIDLPLIIASFWSISAFYLMAQHELFPKDWKRALLLMPALMAAGVALTLVNTKAVLEALFGIKSAFARTAKYAVGNRKLKIDAGEYRRRSGWLPYAELAVGSYFVLMVKFAIDTWNFPAIPFLLLFVAGYWWAGFSTLYQELQGKLRWQRERAAAALEKNAA
ncbi:MAG TPA: cellulose synthase family protein [Bryobacteraceae bacterium]|nr:cellulose synthase family protein [Bryobacteraceae bacterium]